MENNINYDGLKITCAGCMRKETIANIKRIGGKYYCKNCQDIIYTSLTNKIPTEEVKETTEN
jgi:hypothetical protein